MSVAPIASTYAQSRQAFLAAADRSDARVESFVHPLRGPYGEELAIDTATVGSDHADSVLVVVSGTHGVEGYAGSALQTCWLTTAQPPIPASVRVVHVHGLNPYGFAWVRRVNEDNVDLNRNFIDWSQPPVHNQEYDRLAAILVPKQWDDTSQAETMNQLLAELERVGMDALQEAISSGQYQHPTGVFYGGTNPVWSHRWLKANAEALVGKARRLGIIDLHTGLGPWGHGELIIHESSSDPAYHRAKQWWGTVNSMTDGQSVSAALSGDWLGTTTEIFGDVETTAAALEFGTVDPITVLQALRADAWLHSNGEPEPEAGDRIRAQVRAAFIDDDPAWLEALAARFGDVVDEAVAGLANP